ncbi:hypothetical protein HK096_002872 [Nowakowskiella sp. JEL0078]|nr:hypothetical protein HK096_002872 [Nowakowskiella sp. JEL0078]
MGFPCLYDAIFAGSPVGEVRLLPASDNFIQLPYYKNHGIVLSDMIEKESGEPYNLCPRNSLKKIIKEIKIQHEITVKAGFEIEFVLYSKLNHDGTIVPLDSTVYCDSKSFDNKAAVIIDDIVESIQNHGIEVLQFHSESANGQFEIALKFKDVLAAADELIFARQTIIQTARLHEVFATFAPKPLPFQAGNSNHVHLSLWKDNSNIFPEKNKTGISETGQFFMAGVLKHLRSISALTMPSKASYERVQPGTWSGAFVSWGYENRETPIRVTSPTGSIDNFELKAFDGTANPYLGLCAILAAGLDGITQKTNLPPSVNVDPVSFVGTPERLREMPKSLTASLSELENDETLKNALGFDLFSAFIKVRRSELEVVNKMKDSEYKTLIFNRY